MPISRKVNEIQIEQILTAILVFLRYNSKRLLQVGAKIIITDKTLELTYFRIIFRHITY